MYEEYFHLTETPFRLTPDPRFLYITPKHRETLSALVYGVMARKGFMVVSGDAGTGKTTLIHAVLGMLTERRVDCAFIFHPLLEPEEFLEHVLLDLGIPPPSRKKGDMLRALHLFLLKRHECGSTTALIVDEAHKLTQPLLEEIRLFSNLETSTDKLLQIVLAGQSELDDLFRQDNLRQLKQRISIRTRLVAFTLQQTNDYIAHRLGTVGRDSRELFPPDTIRVVYKLSRGIPRLINSICDNALLLAFAQQAECVSVAMLREVCADLDLGEMDTPEVHDPAPVLASAASVAISGNVSGNGFAAPPVSGSVVAAPAPAPNTQSSDDSPAPSSRTAVDTSVAAVATDLVAPAPSRRSSPPDSPAPSRRSTPPDSPAPSKRSTPPDSPAPSGRSTPPDSPAPSRRSTLPDSPKLAAKETELAAVSAHSLRTLDSYSERKGTMNLLTKWANRFRTPDRE